MLNMRIDTLVNALVRQELQRKGNEKALHFQFDVQMGVFREHGQLTERRGLQLLYYAKPGHNYITVFSAVTEKSFVKVEEVTDWKFEVCHDSCWSDISAVSKLYFELSDILNSRLAEKGYEQVAPKDMSEFNCVPFGFNLFDWVPVEVTMDDDDSHRYRRKVKVLK